MSRFIIAGETAFSYMKATTCKVLANPQHCIAYNTLRIQPLSLQLPIFHIWQSVMAPLDAPLCIYGLLLVLPYYVVI